MAGRALSFLATSLLLLGVLLPTNVVAAPADKDGHVVPTAIHDRARAEGEVRVLVELLLPSGRVAEGAVPSQARPLYRQEITDAASRLLSRLTQHPHRVLRRYVTAPLIALEAGPTALQALDASSSLVKRVTEDRIHTPVLLDSVPLIGADKDRKSTRLNSSHGYISYAVFCLKKKKKSQQPKPKAMSHKQRQNSRVESLAS